MSPEQRFAIGPTPTAAVNALEVSLSAEDRQAIAFLDLQRLYVEREGRTADIDDTQPAFGMLSCLRAWERLARRMEQDWPRTDYFTVHEYLCELTIRDLIEHYLDAMPETLRVKVWRAVKRLDQQYKAVTKYDGGTELGQYWRPLAEGREVRWWWVRTPLHLPPGW